MNELLAALDLEQIPRISLGTAALLIFGAIASLAMLRGLFRILWGTVCVCVAGYLAFLIWQQAPALTQQHFGSEITWLSMTLPPFVFLATLVCLRALGRFVIRPLGTPNEETAEKNRRSPIRWALTLLFSLIPTALLWFTGATIVRHFGSVAEIQKSVNDAAGSVSNAPDAFLAQLKEEVESLFPQSWYEVFDPLTDDARVKLAKLISVADEPPPKAIPVLEVPEIQSLITSDEHLRQLAREGRYSEILRDPRLDQLLENDDLREVLSDIDL